MASRSLGVRLADYTQRAATGILGECAFLRVAVFLTALRSATMTVYLAYKVYEGSGIVKKKIEGEQGERIARMESDLKQWAEEDRLAKEAKKD